MKKAIFVIMCTLILGCTDNYQKSEIPKETNHLPLAFFCAKSDCNKALAELISGSKESVHCALYDVDSEKVRAALDTAGEKLEVRLFIDDQNNNFKLKNVQIKADDSFQLSHNKFCIFDSTVVWTGSYNPSEKKIKNDDNALILYSTYLSKNYEDEFKELWERQYGKGEKVNYPKIFLNDELVENYFCPEDCISQLSSTNSKGQAIYKITDLLTNAKESIYFMTFSFTSEDIADAILFNKNNADIRGVFEKTQAGSQYSQYKRLKEFGLDVRLDKNSAFMHHKVFIIDNSTVITGSWNPTASGTERNDENILIIHDRTIAQKYLKEFERVYSASN